MTRPDGGPNDRALADLARAIASGEGLLRLVIDRDGAAGALTLRELADAAHGDRVDDSAFNAARHAMTALEKAGLVERCGRRTQPGPVNPGALGPGSELWRATTASLRPVGRLLRDGPELARVARVARLADFRLDDVMEALAQPGAQEVIAALPRSPLWGRDLGDADPPPSGATPVGLAQDLSQHRANTGGSIRALAERGVVQTRYGRDGTRHLIVFLEPAVDALLISMFGPRWREQTTPSLRATHFSGASEPVRIRILEELDGGSALATTSPPQRTLADLGASLGVPLRDRANLHRALRAMVADGLLTRDVRIGGSRPEVVYSLAGPGQVILTHRTDLLADCVANSVRRLSLGTLLSAAAHTEAITALRLLPDGIDSARRALGRIQWSRRIRRLRAVGLVTESTRYAFSETRGGATLLAQLTSIARGLEPPALHL